MNDYLVRATAADGQIRAFAATTRETVETAREKHDTSPVVTAALGRLLTAASMMGSMLKNENDLLTIQVKGDGPMRGMTVTADAKARVRGYAYEPQVILPANALGKLDVGTAVGQGRLIIIKDMGLKEPYVGQTVLQTGEIAEDLTYYFATSEQIPSSVGLGVLMEKNNTVKQAGGFILQLMPFADDAVITALEKKLQEISSVTAMLEAGNTPEQILEILLGEMDLKIQDTVVVEYYCNCDRARVERALTGIGRKDLQEMIDEGKEIEVNCDFCNTKYIFTVEELKGLWKA